MAFTPATRRIPLAVGTLLVVTWFVWRLGDFSTSKVAVAAVAGTFLFLSSWVGAEWLAARTFGRIALTAVFAFAVGSGVGLGRTLASAKGAGWLAAVDIGARAQDALACAFAAAVVLALNRHSRASSSFERNLPES